MNQITTSRIALALVAVAAVLVISTCEVEATNPARSVLAARSVRDRLEAARAVAESDEPCGAEAEPRLLEGLEDPDRAIRYWSCAALGRLRQAEAATLQRLERLVLDEKEDKAVRAAAVRALRALR